MVTDTIVLSNAQGFHMRPASVFATAMAPFASEVTLLTAGGEVNGKSLMALVASGMKCGTEIEVRCEGADEAEALAKAMELLAGGMGE